MTAAGLNVTRQQTVPRAKPLALAQRANGLLAPPSSITSAITTRPACRSANRSTADHREQLEADRQRRAVRHRRSLRREMAHQFFRRLRHRKGEREWINFPSREYIEKERGERKFDARRLSEAAIAAIKVVVGGAT